MKRLYHQYRQLRVWFLRRRLRQMGFREVADLKLAETLVRLQMDPSEPQRLLLEGIKVALAVAVAGVGLIFGLRLLEPIPIIVPPPEMFPSSPSLPDTFTPECPHFEEPNPHRYAA
jgi:hypothetical protein